MAIDAVVVGVLRILRHIAVGGRDGILLVVLQAEHDAALVGGLTEDGVNGFARAVVFIGLAVVDAEFRTLIVGARDDVDHARDRVGTVHGRSAIVQHFDAFHDRYWQQVRVLQLERNTVAVDEQQCAVGTETAQKGNAGCACTAVVDLWGHRSAGHGRQFLHEVAQVHLAGRLDLRTVDVDHDGACRFDVDTADVRTGHHDGFEGLAFSVRYRYPAQSQ